MGCSTKITEFTELQVCSYPQEYTVVDSFKSPTKNSKLNSLPESSCVLPLKLVYGGDYKNTPVLLYMTAHLIKSDVISC